MSFASSFSPSKASRRQRAHKAIRRNTRFAVEWLEDRVLLADVTYPVSVVQGFRGGGWEVYGNTITTDGTLGVITPNDFVDAKGVDHPTGNSVGYDFYFASSAEFVGSYWLR